MMRTALTVFLLLLPILSVGAQTKLTGKVTDTSGQAIAHAIVQVIAEGKKTPDAYTKTNEKGTYALQISPDIGNKLTLKFSALGYHTATRAITNHSCKTDVQLQVNPTGLREAVAHSPVVREHGDTITYQVSQLKSESDRNIEDVIRRIPGVSISGNGQIKYNGESINRFYIEGMDMLSGRYSLATRNIRPEDVVNVSVYENHQPLRVLQGKERSTQAALNLKLRGSRLRRPVGNMLAGGGWGDSPLYKGELFLFFADSLRQHLATFKGNNFCENYESESLSHYGLNATSWKAQAADFFPDNPFGRPSLPADRYQSNHSALASANNLLKLSDNTTLTVNANYTLTRTSHTLEANTAYYTGEGQTIVVSDDNHTTSTQHQGDLMLKWERNDSLCYLLNHLYLQGSWKRMGFDLWGQHMQQHNASDSWSIANELQLVKQRGKRMTQIYSQVMLGQAPNGNLTAWADSTAGQQLRQQIEGLSFYTRHYTSMGWGLGQSSQGGSLSLYLDLITDWNQIDFAYSDQRSATPGNAGSASDEGITQLQPAARARTNGYSIRGTAGPKYSFMRTGFSATLSVPVTMYCLQYRDHQQGTACDLFRPYIQPNLELLLGIPRKRIMFSLGASYNYHIGSLREFVKQPIYLSYRQLSETGSGQLNQIKLFNLTGQLRWNSPIIGRNILLIGGFSRNRQNTLSSSLIQSNGQMTTETLQSASYTTEWNGMFRLSKNFYGLRAGLSLTGGINASRSPMLRQGLKMRVLSRLYNLGTSAEKRLFDDHLSVRVTATWNRMATILSQTVRTKTLIDDWAAMMQLSASPVSKLELYATGKFTANGVPGSTFNKQFFLDGGARLKLRKIELELSARNLTSQRTYIYRSYALSDMLTYTCHLRPAEGILTMKWNF